jgi:hypothetical protein
MTFMTPSKQYIPKPLMRLRFFLDEMIDIIKRAHLASHKFRSTRVPTAASSSAESSASPRSTAASATLHLDPSKETIKAVAGDRPIMGPDVLVSNLWVVKDLWDWMFPGYHKNEKEATQRGAIVYYERLQHYRDFKFQREQSDPGDKSGYVGKEVHERSNG